MPLLVVSAFMDYLMICLGVLSSSTLAFLSFRLFVRPSFQKKAEESVPPSEGYQKFIVFRQHDKVQEIKLGKRYGDIPFRLEGIQEEQLSIQFKRELNIEEYNISCKSNGTVLLQLPHTRQFKKIKGKEDFTSSELIGSPAFFRLVAFEMDGKPLQFIELKLSAKFFFNSSGQEQIEFLLTVIKIYPPVNISSRNKKGVYEFQVLLGKQEESINELEEYK